MYVGVRRIIGLVSNPKEGDGAREIVLSIGPGTWVILFCSLLVFWTLLRGAAAGAKKDKERKEAARAARKR